ncbi:MAG: DNA polymerase/3'-5' exonuclease PolX, partial [Bacteroidota bacterium]
VELEATRLLQYLEEKQVAEKISFTGSLRRKCEVLESGELIATDEQWDHLSQHISDYLEGQAEVKSTEDRLRFLSNEGIPVEIIKASRERFEEILFHTTASQQHLDWLKTNRPEATWTGTNETAIYASVGLPYLEPEFREGMFEDRWLQKGVLPIAVEYVDLKGTLHNHSTYSDGMHTLEEMANYCKSMGFDYLGICDHSQSAFYANGLKPDRILKQHEEIDRLNARLAPFHIFKGIESDILIDGSLDYADDVLASFDFIVASIHSVLRMDKEKATNRIIKAVEHPRTTILGHPTGRLLLAREGYPLDMEKVIDACAANGVVMELNANPYRLDLDWRYIPYALEKGVMISINPDAHRKEGYHDMHYGVCVARKGGLEKQMTFNCFDLETVKAHFKKRK